MANGGRAALLYHLLNMDLKGWHPRDMTDTQGLIGQKLQSLGPLEQWVLALVRDPYSANRTNRTNDPDVPAMPAFPADSKKVPSWAKDVEWDKWEDASMYLGSQSEIYDAFSFHAWRSMNTRYMNVLSVTTICRRLKKLLGDELFDRHTKWMDGKLRKIWAIGSRKAIVKRLNASMPGVVDDVMERLCTRPRE